MQDFGAVNEAVAPIHPLVPNADSPHPSARSAQYFSVMNLKVSFSVSIYIQTLNAILPLNGGTLTP